MFKKKDIAITASLCVFIFICFCSCSQNKNKQYIKGYCKVSKTKHHYTVFWALNMNYSFAVYNDKGTVLDKIADRNTSLTPKGGAGSGVSGQKKTGICDFNLVVIEQDDDKGIFIFDILMRYKGKIYQAKIKKLITFDGKKTEIFSFNINDYVKDPKLLKKLNEYYTKKIIEARNRIMNPPYPLDTPPFKTIRKEPDAAKRRQNIIKKCRAPQFKKGSLEKYFRDEKKGLNIKDSTNVERIKKGLEPVLSLSRKPITWEINPKRKTE